MIENELQYQVTLSKLKELEQQLAALDPRDPNLHPRQIIGWRNSFNLTIRQLNQEIAEYEQHLEDTTEDIQEDRFEEISVPH
jgi:nitrate reductase alpha subunit